MLVAHENALRLLLLRHPLQAAGDAHWQAHHWQAPAPGRQFRSGVLGAGLAETASFSLKEG